MRTRSTFRAAAMATALLCGALAWPHAATATPAPPVISAMGPVCTATGLAIGFHVNAPSDVTSVSVSFLTSPTTTVSTVTTLELVSGTARSGTWQSTGPLGLPAYGSYGYQVHVTDQDGVTADSPVIAVDYRPSPAFHDVVWAPTTVDYSHRLLTVIGRLTTYDPATGDTGATWSNPVPGVNVYGPDGLWYNTPSAPDGTFKLSRSVGAVHDTTYGLMTTGPCAGPTSPPINSVVSHARITLDKTSASHVTSNVTITGKAEWQQPDGTWAPVAHEPLRVDDRSSNYIQVTTDASGRFSYTVNPIPGLHGYDFITQDTYLTPTDAPFVVQSDTRVFLAAQQATVDASSHLRVQGFFESPAMPVPQGRVYIQQSANGKTGWTTIGSVDLKSSNPYENTGIADTNASGIPVNPHGYWRYYYPGAVGYTPAYSQVLHAFRYETAISGGRPAATSATRNHRITIRGTLRERGYGSWTCLPKTKVSIQFRPAGSTTWYTVTTAWTDPKGRFSASPRATRSGTWRTVYWAADQWHVNAFGPATWVTAR